MIKKLISGGQTGVDRAALDVGIELRIPVGGACPRGRIAEDGPIPQKYPLEELASSDYFVRTRKNVADADGTLILHLNTLSGGTALTKKYAEELGKPYLIVNLDKIPRPRGVLKWLEREGIEVLNVAGPRESTNPGMYHQAAAFLHELLSL